MSGGVERVELQALTIPTDRPESDGTLAWDSTTMIVLELHAGGERGLGYGYGPVAVGHVLADQLAGVLRGCDPLHPPAAWLAMHRALRNAGAPGIGAMALSIADIALHDLRARRLGVPLVAALGGVRDRAAAYGSGGFCTYGPDEVAEQLGGWAREGYERVKLKVGRDPDADPARLRAAREAIGPDVGLMVDANGAFTPAEAIAVAERYREHGVDWLEEAVSSRDRRGLRRVRDRAPAGMAIAAGEYAWDLDDAAGLLRAEAVDVLQADVTRCGGLTAVLRIDALAAAHGLPTSLHCAPAIAAHAGCAMQTFVHLEAFHDHLRIERMLLDGLPSFASGSFVPGDTPGHGLALRGQDASRWRAWERSS
jgi:L-alanine-DL-glutamate epimerase-like enolase superfamily enzyme